MTKLHLSQWVKGASESLWSSLASNPAQSFYFLLLCLLPVQLGKHFWPAFSYVSGLRVDYLSPTLYLTDVVFLAFFLFSLPLLKKVSIRSWIILSLVFLYLFFLALFSLSPLNSLLGVLRLGEYAYFALATSIFLSTKSGVKNALLVFSFSTLVVSLLALAQFFLQHSVGGPFYFLGERTFSQQTLGIANASLQGTLVLRPYATFPHPNVLAGFLLISLTLLLFLPRQFANELVKKRLLVLLLRLTFFMGLTVLFLTLSRTAVISFVLVLVLWLLERKKLPLRSLFLGGVIVSVALVLSGLMLRFFSLSLQDEAVTTRITQIKDAVALFLKSPLFGLGYKNYLVSLPEVLTVFTSVRFLQPVHNIFLLILVETGLIGFLASLVGLVKLVRPVVSSRNFFKLSLFVILLLPGMFDHYFYTLHQGQFLAAFVIGVLLAKPRFL